MAAPFTRDYCPVCAAQTRHRFLAQADASPDTGDELWAICEVCKTVLIYGEDGLIGQRPATEAERAACPPPPSAEAMAAMREDLAAMREELRQGWAAYEEWVRAGCPGLTSEMVSAMPLLAAALAKRGVCLPRPDGSAPERPAGPGVAPDPRPHPGSGES
jgi:hypothetical protein